MEGSSPESDSKPAARPDDSEPKSQAEASFDPTRGFEQHAAIANLLSLQGNELQTSLQQLQQQQFASAAAPAEAQPQHDQAPYSYPASSLYAAESAAGFANLLPASAPSLTEDAARQLPSYPATSLYAATAAAGLPNLLPASAPSISEDQIRQSQLSYMLLQEQFLQQQQHHQRQLQQQQGLMNLFAGSPVTQSDPSVSSATADFPYSNSMTGAIPYSGAAAAVADVASAFPQSQRDFAVTFRNQTAHLQRQNFNASTDRSRNQPPHASKAAKAKKSKASKEKEKGRPKRPLSAYNLFFKEERQAMLSQIPDKPKDDMQHPRRSKKNPNRSKPHGKVSFESMAKIIGAKWQNCPSDRKKQYQRLAEADGARYKAEMEVWKSRQAAAMTEQHNLLAQQVDPKIMEEYIQQQSEAAEQQQHARNIGGGSSTHNKGRSRHRKSSGNSLSDTLSEEEEDHHEEDSGKKKEEDDPNEP